MRKFLALSFILLLAVSLSAQVRTGNIYGRAVDTEGNPLPGVSVTLTGQYTAPLTTVTGPEGAFRFLSLPASSDYAVRLELTGFKTKIEENIVIAVGANVNLTVVMEVGMIEEAITVTAVSPLVDQKKTSVGQNVTQDILQSLPSARDPWVILQMAPGVIADRENVGGTESGMQSTMTARGGGSSQSVWAMDGVVITDPAAIGASPSYYDFDAFEEMQITVGGADVTIQTGGIALNLVTRRGGNRVSLGGRFYYTDGAKFQSDNLTEAHIAEGLVRTNRIRIITDYGFNLGAPIIKDKAWFWGSFGVQDIQTTTIQDIPFDTMLTNFAAKLNIQPIAANRFEAFIHAGKKEMWGRDSSATFLPGRYQGGAYHFGSPIIKFQDEHMFGDSLFLSAKYSWSNAGFNLTPMNDRSKENWMFFDRRQWTWLNGWTHYAVNRPHTQAELSAHYFNDTLFGVSHEIKVGALYSTRSQAGGSSYAGNILYYGNWRPGLDIRIDFNGDGFRTVPGDNWYDFYLYRNFERQYNVDSYAGYFSDTISFGRLNLTLGVRYDHQIPYIQAFSIDTVQPWHKTTSEKMNAQTQAALSAALPGVDVPAAKAFAADGSAYSWRVLSPRIGLVWDVTGDGKTLAKLNLAQYGDFMGVGEAWYWEPGGTGGWLRFWWEDDGDGIMDYSELYWLRSRTAGDLWLHAAYPAFDAAGNLIGDLVDAGDYYYGGYNPANPIQLTDPFGRLDRNAGSSRTSEVLLTLEREVIPDFALSLNATFRRFDNFRWSLKYFLNPDGTETEVNAGMFEVAGTPPATLPGLGSTKDAANQPYYYATTAFTAYSPYYNVRRQPNRYNDFYSVDLIFNKRLSNKWMLNGSFTLQNQQAIYGEGSYLSPNNIWAFDKRPYAPFVGGAAGKINQYTWSRWLFKVGGLYQLPYGFNVSFQFNAREGWLIRESFTLWNQTIPNAASRSHTLDMTPFASDRMPLFYNLSFRLEKEIRAGDFGRIYIMADVFNALNSSVENRRYQKFHGTFYWYGPDHASNLWAPDPLYYQLNEILNPRVFRLGVRFQF